MIDLKYYELKASILALANSFFEADEETRAKMRKAADFFPISKDEGSAGKFHSMMIRVGGELFLVENTEGGEKGVFALLYPFI